MPTWFAVSISCLLIYLAFIVWAQTRFGSYRYALSYLQGSRIQVWPAFQDVGTHRPGEPYQSSVTLRNHGGSPIVVAGALADCQCIAYRGLPRTIPPGGSVSLPVTIRFGKTTGDWHQSISYLTDAPHQPALRAGLVGRVVLWSDQIQPKAGSKP